MEPQESSQRVLEPEEFSQRVLVHARALAASRGYQLGEGADSFIESQARQAASQAVPAAADDQAKMLANAQEAAGKLIDAMIAQAQAIPGYRETNPGKIGEQTLGAALAGICPLWPFC